jgi:hypothetical protein
VNLAVICPNQGPPDHGLNQTVWSMLTLLAADFYNRFFIATGVKSKELFSYSGMVFSTAKITQLIPVF